LHHFSDEAGVAERGGRCCPSRGRWPKAVSYATLATPSSTHESHEQGQAPEDRSRFVFRHAPLPCTRTLAAATSHDTAVVGARPMEDFVKTIDAELNG
jgi:hypothetical protein